MKVRRLRCVAAVLATLVVASGCGQGRSGGPRGEPVAVVRSAPDRTFAGGSAAVEGAAPDATSSGRVSLGPAGGGGTATPSTLPLEGRGAAKGYPELANPLAMVDLVRGAVAVVAYGGVAVRGVSTFRYETVINVERALRSVPEGRRAEVAAVAEALGSPAFYADVWIDEQGRLRRIQVPVTKTTARPATRDRRTPKLITVDLFDYRVQDR